MINLSFRVKAISITLLVALLLEIISLYSVIIIIPRGSDVTSSSYQSSSSATGAPVTSDPSLYLKATISPSKDSFGGVSDVILDNKGFIYVADTADQLVKVFDSSFKLVKEYNTSFFNKSYDPKKIYDFFPYSLALDNQGNLYVSSLPYSGMDDIVEVFSTISNNFSYIYDKISTMEGLPHGNGAISLTQDKDGRIYALIKLDNPTVYVNTSKGVQLANLGSAGFPLIFVYSKENNSFILPEGQLTYYNKFGSEVLKTATSITTDGKYIYILLRSPGYSSMAILPMNATKTIFTVALS